MEHPCKDCITLSICQTPMGRSHSNVAHPLTALANKCCMFNSYIRLKDLKLKMPPDDMPMEERRYFTVPMSKRILTTCSVLGWTNKYDLAHYADIVYGDGS